MRPISPILLWKEVKLWSIVTCSAQANMLYLAQMHNHLTISTAILTATPSVLCTALGVWVRVVPQLWDCMDLCSSAWLHADSWVFSMSKQFSSAAWHWLLQMIEQSPNQSKNCHNILPLQSWIFIMLTMGSSFKPDWAWTQISLSVLVDISEVKSGVRSFLVINFPAWGMRSLPPKL